MCICDENPTIGSAIYKTSALGFSIGLSRHSLSSTLSVDLKLGTTIKSLVN